MDLGFKGKTVVIDVREKKEKMGLGYKPHKNDLKKKNKPTRFVSAGYIVHELSAAKDIWA